MIYEWITARGILTEEHKADLKTKRGFTDETIKRNRFFSGGQYLLALEKELTEAFKVEDLLEAGIFITPKKSKTPVFNQMLLEDRIIIPYLDKDGKATLIRPHKMGLAGVGVAIYQPFNLVWDEKVPRFTFDENCVTETKNLLLSIYASHKDLLNVSSETARPEQSTLQSMSRQAYEGMAKNPSFKCGPKTEDDLSELFQGLIKTGKVDEERVRGLWSACSNASSRLRQSKEDSLAVQGSSRASAPDSTTLIITEGEFKACAARQLGANCIALPGVGSFSGEHYPKLITFLNDNQIKNICIIFDNEVKDDPAFPNYKPDAMDRYDTQYYAFIMAKALNKDGFTTRIGTLPDVWRVRGKIDIDGALAQGKTAGDLDGVCRRSLSPQEYEKEFDEEAKEVIRKKEAKRFFRTHVRVQWGKYVAKRFNGKREWEEEISNFTIKIVATHETFDGIVRELRIVNEFGKSKVFSAIRPEDMMGNDSFATFCAAHGNFVWKGTKQDLYAIWEYEFLNDSGRHIIEPDCIGWLPEQKIWAFGNVAFVDGKEMRPDESGIFWTEKCGYKPVPLGVSSGKSMISEGIPYLNMNKCDFQMILDKLSESVGPFEAKTIMGWCFAVLFMEEVFQMYGCFPFLFITGRRRSGKSTVAEWAMNFFGLENTGKQAADTTPVAVQRYMSYYSSLPFFLDEYRNDAKVTIKNGLLRNAYNRQSAGKGMKSEFGIREAKVRGSIIIAGEETPNDNALLTRCVVVQVSELARKVNNFDWFTKNRQLLSSFAYTILADREKFKLAFLPRMAEDKMEIAAETKDDRLAINKAVVSAGYWCLFGKDPAFAKAFMQELREVKRDQENESAVSMFFEDLKALSFDRSLHLNRYWKVDDGKIYLYFHGLYNIYSKDYQSRRREAPFKAEAIRGYLKDEPGFVNSSINYRVNNDGTARCVVFTEALAPDFIKELVSVPVEGLLEPTGTPTGTAERVDTK